MHTFKFMTMENEEKKSTPEDSSSQSSLERGKKAIEADEKIAKKDTADPKVQEEKKKDAEKWRNEG